MSELQEMRKAESGNWARPSVSRALGSVLVGRDQRDGIEVAKADKQFWMGKSEEENMSKKAIVPVWAQRIEVEQRIDDEQRPVSLLVHGWGHLPFYLDPKKYTNAPRLDLLERLRRYALRQLKSPNNGDPSLSTYQFADASDDEKLTAFVSCYGPVWGETIKIEDEGATGSYTVTVEQNLEQLRREQKIFSAAVGLLAEVNKNGRADRQKVAELLVRLAYPDQPAGKSIWGLNIENFVGKTLEPLQLFALEATAPPWTGKAADNQKVIACAHAALCHQFNLHRPVLFRASEQPIELPEIATDGIREALYYTLRLDYLAQRAMGTCLNCGGHFPITRRGQKGCSERCRRRLRNLRYRTQSGKSRRARRMQ
jgi:hypothetical protein